MDAKIKNDALRRLNILTGHLGKVKKMISDEAYCIDILQQSSAVQSALKQVDALILDNHLNSCMVKKMAKKTGKKEAIDELLEIFRRR